MKIYSWNMLFRNKKLDEALRWIEKLDFDILCLQEVPEPFLEMLRSLPWHIASASEGVRHFAKEDIPAYVAIVSKHPIAGQEIIPLPDAPLTLRAQAFIRAMRPFHFCRVSGRNALRADIALPGRAEPLRVISAHVSLSHPAQRAEELAVILANAKPGDTVICGDFNIIESPRASAVNFLMGGAARDAVRYQDERASVETLFGEHDFHNPLRYQITHPFSLSQLDHILTPASFKLKRSGVSVHAYGSDHRPIFIETASP
jgi:endonuclease/exonuclease/phosphatase family metal-dependent hydrolase